MGASDTLRDSLEDFGARALAVDPADLAHVGELRQALEAIRPAVSDDAPPARLLDLMLETLSAIDHEGHPEPQRLLDAVADASAAIVRDITCENDGLLLQPAADALRSQLSMCRAEPAAGPEPRVDVEEPAPVTGDFADSTPSSIESDPELIRDFIAEACDRMSDAESALLALEATPDDKEQVDTILRAFHTVKGASGFLGLDNIQELAHLAESLLIRARDGQIRMADEHADLALGACDVLRSMIVGLDPATRAQDRLDPAKLADVLARLSGSTESSAPERAAPAAAPAVASPAAPEQEEPEDEDHAGTAAQSPASKRARTHLEAGVRVSAERLDDLVNMVGELVIAHSIMAQSLSEAEGANSQVGRSVSHAGKILRSLQDLTLGLSMVPLQPTFGKMARLVRDLARKSGKNVKLLTSGEDTEIDRNMVEALSDPLVHMMRNAVDHGIESPDVRRAAGKDPVGTIELRAYHSAGNVVIELADDGRGLDREKILARAVERGLVRGGEQPGDAELLSLIFRPGFSTAEKVTDVSGRGVGMDVAKTGIESLRGRVKVLSQPGEGSTFTILLPLTMATADAMLVRVGTERYLLPTVSIEQSFRPDPQQLSTVAGRGEMVMARNELLPVLRLGRLFNIDGTTTDPTRALLIVIESQGCRYALLVDELLGQQQVVIKSLGPTMGQVPGVCGGAILGDGRVGLILDPAGLRDLINGPGDGTIAA